MRLQRSLNLPQTFLGLPAAFVHVEHIGALRDPGEPEKAKPPGSGSRREARPKEEVGARGGTGAGAPPHSPPNPRDDSTQGNARPPWEGPSSSGPAAGAPSLEYAKQRPLSQMGFTALQDFGRDLTLEARAFRLDPVFGREAEIQRVLQILMRRTKNNAVLIGEPGTGKTAIAEGVAQIIASPACPRGLELCRIVALDVGGLVAGTQYRGAFEERLQAVIEEARRSEGTVIIFADELHMLLSAGAVEGGLSAANLLKPSLARGELRMIGATTTAEYREHVEGDAAFARRFMPVHVEEPSLEGAALCLEALRPRYEKHHQVVIGQDCIEAAVTVAHRYLTDRRLPDSAIDLMDEASSLARMEAVMQAEAAAGVEVGTGQAAGTVTGTSSGASGAGSAGKSLSQPAVDGYSLSFASVDAGVASPASRNAAEYTWARPCPHCGFAVPAIPGAQTITCARCDTRFLNIDPQKLLLGVTVMPRPAHAPTSEVAGRGAKQQPGSSGVGDGSAAVRPTGTAPPLPSGAGFAASGAASAARAPLTPSIPVVSRRHVLEVATRASGVPVRDLVEGERSRLSNLEAHLRETIVGQDSVVRSVAGAVRASRMGLGASFLDSSGSQGAASWQGGAGARRRPTASFILHGPPGTGKSLLCRTLGATVFGPPQHTLRLDMAEYAQANSVSKLIGAPPGFVGYGKGGVLTEAVRTRPYSLLQLEHVDRAHPEVLALLAQVLEEGSLTDSQGRKVHFGSTIIMMTVDEYAGQGQEWERSGGGTAKGEPRSAGFDDQGSNRWVGRAPRPRCADHHPSVHTDAVDGRDRIPQAMPSAAHAAHASAAVMEEEEEQPQAPHRASKPRAAGASGPSALRRVPREIVSRVDSVLRFEPLSDAHIGAVVRKSLSDLMVSLSDSVRLEVSSGVEAALREAVLARGGSAADVGRVIKDDIVMPLSELSLAHATVSGDGEPSEQGPFGVRIRVADRPGTNSVTNSQLHLEVIA